jgi:hypothetical protein
VPRSELADPGPLGVYSDAARRASDIVATHLLADPGNVGRWVAIRLSDGGSDGTTYADLRSAVAFQLHYKQCMYIQIPAGGMPPREAEVMLTYYRRVYDAGNIPPNVEAVL